MKRQWLINPRIGSLEEHLALAERYNTHFEFHEFYFPQIYEDEEAVRTRIERYNSIGREPGWDTLHGVFFSVDPGSMDTVIREYSQKIMRQSMEIASRLSCRGVVFHSSLIAGLNIPVYLDEWLDSYSAMMRHLCTEYPDIDVWTENTYEYSPKMLIKLAQVLSDVPNFGLCLDYGHALLTPTPIEDWVREMAPYVRHMHMNDNDLESDLHQAPGDGKIDYKECFTLLERYNVHTPVLLELEGAEKQERGLRFLSDLTI